MLLKEEEKVESLLFLLDHFGLRQESEEDKLKTLLENKMLEKVKANY